jgi:hypothetical protein
MESLRPSTRALRQAQDAAQEEVVLVHLKRYLAEFDFRYNERMALGVNDTERATKALKGVVGKRLTYRQPHQRAHV